MPFSDADNPLSIRRHSAISVTQASRWRLLWCDCLWFSVAFLPVQTLVLEIRKEDRVAEHAIGAAAVFVRAGARIERRRDGVRNFSIGRTADNRDSAGFIRAALEPVQFATRKMEFAEPNAG